MSDGKFSFAKYVTNLGLVTVARIQEESLSLTLNSIVNSDPGGSVTPGLPSAKASGSHRAIGIICRKVRVKLTVDGTGVNVGMKAGTVHSIPVFSATQYEAFSKGQTGTYKGIACVYAGHTAEAIN